MKPTHKQKQNLRASRVHSGIITVALLLSPVFNLLPVADAAPMPTGEDLIIEGAYAPVDRYYDTNAVRAVITYTEPEEKLIISPEAIHLPVDESVEAMIRRLAAARGFAWPDYLVKLARCESGLRADATNDRNNYPKGSVDRGLFQISDYWHSEVSDAVAFDPVAATEWTMWRIESGYQHEWMCDRIIKKK